MLARKKKTAKIGQQKNGQYFSPPTKKKTSFFFFVLKKKNCQQNFFVSQIILLANFLWKSFVFLDFLRVFLLFFLFLKKKLPTFPVGKPIFFLGQNCFFSKNLVSKKKNCQQKPRRPTLAIAYLRLGKENKYSNC